MKKSCFLFIGLLLMTISAQAQKFYIRGGPGIAVSTAASNNYDVSTSPGSSSVLTAHKKGIGTGLPFVLAGGYTINDYFGFELGIDYFYGFSLASKTTSQSYSSDSKWRGQMLSIVPAFVMTLPLDKIKPYARLGLKLGVLNTMIFQDHSVLTIEPISKNVDYQMNSKGYGGIAIGAQAAVGTDFKLSEMLSLFGEIQLDGISYSPKRGKYTEYTRDGEDQLGSMTVKEKEWKYVKEAPLSNTLPDDQPGEEVTRNFMFGNAGLIIGIKIRL